MHNLLHPDQMTGDERLAELAELLAAGLVRLFLKKSSPLSDDARESSLDLSPARRGHAHRRERKVRK
jgi:hypothetical protein